MKKQFILVELNDPQTGIERSIAIVEELLTSHWRTKIFRVKNFRRIASRQAAVDHLWGELGA